MNPYGVGESGASRRTAVRRCACCDLPFEFEPWAGRVTPPHCESCASHVQSSDESIGRTLARHQDHEQKYRGRSSKLEALIEKAYAERDDCRVQTSFALQTRDEYLDVLAEVERHHRPRGRRCSCGKADPCETTRALQSGGRGRYRRIQAIGVAEDRRDMLSPDDDDREEAEPS